MPKMSIYDENDEPVYVGEASDPIPSDLSFMVAFGSDSPGYELMRQASADRRNHNYTFSLDSHGALTLYEGKVFSFKKSNGVITSRIICDSKK
ncbi:hypothetical protein [uncultured Pseudomonas sp.]|uniref:hypothetical protein n=1 Tax=uncultured Pseudomonas sp. TaxID=114707 RepID=UPI002585BEA4|nr:hypothetical protein [uncultured Pseudomonas sp.]